MRVALIGPVPPELGGVTHGGVATHQEHLARGLAAAGVFAPLLATNAPAVPPRTEVGFPLYPLPGSWTGIARMPRYLKRLMLERPGGSRRDVLRNLMWYEHFLADVRPDLVHVQHPLERCSYARMVLREEEWNAPLVVTAHSLFGEHPDSTIRDLMTPNLRAADRVIAVSEHVAHQVAEIGVPRDRIRVIRSGVDTERFRPRNRAAARCRLGLGHEQPIVLFVGNLEPRKQVDVLVRALKQLPACLLLIVGSGESAGVDDQTAHLRELTRTLQLTDRVRFLGRLSADALLDCYAAANVFALPSSSEAQGIVALEAMASGLVVVASGVGGLLGTIEDGANGFLVRPGDADALALRLQTLLSRPELLDKVGAAARQTIEREFTWPRAISATLEVYRETLPCL